MTDVFRERRHGWIRFNEGPEGWSMVDPEYEPLAEAAHTARYSLSELTQTQAYLLCSAFESYHHLMTHPGGTEYTVGQLRVMRRTLRDLSRAESSDTLVTVHFEYDSGKRRGKSYWQPPFDFDQAFKLAMEIAGKNGAEACWCEEGYA